MPNQCVAGVCLPPGKSPVAFSDRRIVLYPTKLTVLSSKQASVPRAVIPFGEAGAGTTVTLLSFDWSRCEELGKEFFAQIILERASEFMGAFESVTVETATATGHWEPTTLTYARLPNLIDRKKALVLAASPKVLRIDVSESIGSICRNPLDEERSIAILAEPVSRYGPFVSTGLLGAPGPYLEIYAR